MIKNPMFIENWTRVFALIIIGKNYILLSIDVNWKDEKQHIDKPESKSQAQAQSSGLDWIHSNLDWIQSKVNQSVKVCTEIIPDWNDLYPE